MACQTCGNPLVYKGRGRRPTKFCSQKCYSSSDQYRERHRQPGSRKFYMREYLYGISEDEFTALLEAQGGTCAICGSDEWPGKDNAPHVDHDHKTGVVRGILCSNCNHGLGKFKDDPKRLRAAAEYLER